MDHIWVCSKSTNVLTNEWVALSPNKWRKLFCSSLLCGNNHITPRVPLRLHWDWILTHTYVYNGQSTLYLRKAMPIWPWNTLSKFCCPLSHSAELGVPTWKSEESAADLSALAGAHGGTRLHQQVGCHSSHMSMRWPTMRLRSLETQFGDRYVDR